MLDGGEGVPPEEVVEHTVGLKNTSTEVPESSTRSIVNNGASILEEQESNLESENPAATSGNDSFCRACSHNNIEGTHSHEVSRDSATPRKVKKSTNVNKSIEVMCECGQPKRVVKSRKKVQVKTKFGGYKTTSKIVNSHICLDCPRNILIESDSELILPPQLSKGGGLGLRQSQIGDYFRK